MKKFKMLKFKNLTLKILTNFVKKRFLILNYFKKKIKKNKSFS